MKEEFIPWRRDLKKFIAERSGHGSAAQALSATEFFTG
jgi:hypothetical protein